MKDRWIYLREPLEDDDLPMRKQPKGRRLIDQANTIVYDHLHTLAIGEQNPVYEEMLLAMQAEAIIDQVVAKNVQLLNEFSHQLQRLLDKETDKARRTLIRNVLRDVIIQMNAYLELEEKEMIE